MNTYVKTVYEDQKPNITRYRDKTTAESMVRAYREHGIDVVSCEIVDEETALAQVRAKEVYYDRA